MVDCEFQDIGAEQLKSKREYQDRLILFKIIPTEENTSEHYLKCYKCNVLSGLDNYTVDTTDGIVTITPDFECPVISCKAKYPITNGKLAA